MTFDANREYDVVVVGGGNAALCAAISAAENGARVLLLERSPDAERGGNSTYTDGKFRAVYNGVEDVRALVPDLTDDEVAASDFGTYTESDFFDDMGRITQYRTDPDLCEILVRQSREILFWLKEKGVRFMPNYGRQAYRVDGRFKFWGGTTLVVATGGPGLVDALYRTAEALGVTVCYEAWARDLISVDGLGVSGVEVNFGGDILSIKAGAVVLACGSFEANAEWRAKYLGPGWDLAKVRGSKYNTGDGLAMALKIGAQPFGHWSGCHATAWERYASDFGDMAITPQYQRHSYTFGIVVNALGDRFIDEGADFRNYTYAKYGSEVLRQPGQVAWQIYDSKVLHLLTDEYRTRHVTKLRADTLEGLIAQMDEVDGDRLARTISEFNAAVSQDVPFNPNVKDGRRAVGLSVPRSNWANTIDTGPFEAYAVTCGITFAFGGIRITTDGQVVDTAHNPIPGLFAAGEMVGGLFYFNYPGASGLTSGSVFGRLSGIGAARSALSKRDAPATKAVE
ncbi:FAD-binding dehydrogenase [Mesorhizobium sp. M7A.F.Ca.US.006.01.1.1]|uniref:FAD-dependent tricarballylate dehydrogenase TcuA n=1 Tax=Mesorhizobium sp. M7A.F.Ca.US.006.01.1.1 TaxID=2496707 RepID=UPI000FCC1A9E|nr:FAD-dependent tricarballylate dehydrogenase TcuA [Mesorhizobium sp. M7A.F.Ca.US.006.01.1.1]RUZ77978.1 FAD-binding dehydrogenase [Mesorhizobium sp. M7A.F.Ca.US.006.01.1.1]